MLEVILNGETYPMSTSLLVAYRWQGENNNKPYSVIMSTIGEMRLEQQLGLLWVAFDVANKGVMTKKEFSDAFMLEHGMGYLQETIALLIEGIMYHKMNEDQRRDFRTRAKERQIRMQMESKEMQVEPETETETETESF